MPELVVECGVLDGYSTFHIAHALRFNRQSKGIDSQFFAFDLWEEYDYKHGDIQEVQDLIDENFLGDDVALMEGNAFEVCYTFDEDEVDFLHIDISNNGDTILKILDLWSSKISSKGIVVFEGGSYERDKVDWMIKYGFSSISDVLGSKELTNKWEVQVFDPFPSMTLLWKK